MSPKYPLAAALARGARLSWPESQLAALESLLVDHLPGDSEEGDSSTRLGFCEHLGASLGVEETNSDNLAKLALSDLLIAYRCLEGDTRALATLDSLLDSVVPALSERGFSRSDIEEAKQQVRVRLLVAEPGKSPRLSLYKGRGRLGGFLRVAAVRIALNLRRTESRRTIPEQLELLAKTSNDPALAQLRENYLQQFRSALADAWATLEESDKVFVRHQLVDKLTIDEVARVHGVHRSTAARRLIAARDRLVAATRSQLRSALDLSETELRSVLRLIHTQLEVALDAIENR